jgi:hypothetical protein
MEPLMLLTAIVSMMNIRIYKSSKAVFTLGLMFFSIMMMLHNIIAIFAYFVMAPSYTKELHPYFFGIHLTELIGLIVLLKITLV